MKDQSESFLIATFTISELMNCFTGGDDWEKKHVEWIRTHSECVVRPAWPSLSEDTQKILLGIIQKRIPEWKPTQ